MSTWVADLFVCDNALLVSGWKEGGVVEGEEG